MNYKHYALISFVAVAGLVSCSDDNPWAGTAGQGAISLTLSTDGSVKDAVPLVRSGELFDTPDAADFSIRLEKTDGSYSKTFATVADFRNESGFPTGAYTLTAFYGNPEEEGFELPCFEGSTQLTVLEGRTTEASVTAKVSNSLVSITYTDTFKDYLHDYSATVHSEGHTYVPIAADETRPAFIAPGEVSLSVTFTNPQNQTVTLQPASFAAQAGHHYHIILDVNEGNVGQAQLSIIFDDSVESEDVVIDLSEELFTSAAPSVKPVGFASGDALEFLSGEAPSKSLKYNVIAHGGMKEVLLTIASNDYTPAFGKEVNLIGADAAVQQQLAALGIDAKGVFSNPDRMAVVDISALPGKLPAGEYEVSLIAKDMFTRVSEPVSIRFTSVAPTLEVTPMTAIFGVGSGTLGVAYNGSHPSEDISFKALNKYGNYEDCEITGVEDATRTRSFDTKNYIFTIKLPDTGRDELPVKVYLYGNEITTVNLPVIMPQYSVEADAMARKVMVKVITDDSQRAAVVGALRFFNGNTAVDPSDITRNTESGIITVSGLQPATAYTLSATLFSTLDDSAKTLSFTTETAAGVPNGDFEQLEVKYDNVSLTQGGGFTRTLWSSAVHNTQNFTISEPTGWLTSNSQTCSTAFANQNSWFVCPSVFNTTLSWTGTVHKFSPGFGGTTSTPDAYKLSAQSGNNAMAVRSVGWSANGTEPDADKKTAGIPEYYCRNTPSGLSKSAGRLYLGSASGEGAAFAARPSALKGYYTYTCDNGDSSDYGVVTVSVLSGNEVIATATGNLAAASSYKEFSLPLSYNAAAVFGKKPTAVRISIVSSSKSEPSVTNYAELYRQEAVGSVLVVDNLSFEY